jgi:hypothetical protein
MNNLSCHTDLIADKGDPDGRNVQTGLAYQIGYHAIWADSLYFPYLPLSFNFQNPSFIPAYPLTLFIGIFELILIFLEDPL